MINKRFLLFLAGTFLLLLSCDFAQSLLQQGTSPVANYGVDREDAIVLVGGQPRTLDPAKTLGGPGGALGHIFSGLVTLDPQLQVQPDLAAGWTVSDDGLVYTFYLRQNAVFHDGRPLTAADVIYSWQRAANPATGSDTVQTYLGDIEGVQEMLDGRRNEISGLRAIDDHTLEVRLTAPVVYFLAKLTYPVAFVVDGENVDDSDWEHHPNGSGPFTLQTWRDDEIMVLARNDLYHLQPASVSHLVYLLGPGIPLSLYETGQIDMVGIGGDTLERMQDPNNPLTHELRTAVNMCTTTIGLNARRAPFDDARVRQAFNYALDKEQLLETFFNGNSLIATGALPPGMWGYDSSRSGYPFDPDKARQLLADAGYSDPADFPTVTYYTSGYGDVGAYETAVISMWQETLGVTVEPVLIDPYIYYDELYGGNTGHIFSSGWCADYPDPQNFLDVLYHSDSRQNLGGFSNTAVDALLEQARTEQDVESRLALYQEAEAMIVAEAPVVFVGHGLSAVLVKPYIEDYVLTPIGVAQWHHVSLQR